MIFETHAHYDDEAFNDDRNELLKSFLENEISYVVNIGANMKTSRKTLELTKEYDFLYGAVGVHPNEVGDMTKDDIKELKDMSNNEKILAIGEIGLDYYYDKPEKNIQKIWFESQLELAKEVKLPVVIHSRESAKDTLEMMKSIYGDLKADIHCFSYTKETAREFLNLNYYFGIGGVVTFKNAKKLKEAVEYIPIENILLETDSPYLTPEPYRGKRNDSTYIKYIAKTIAEIKNIEYDRVVEITENNAKRFYNLK